MKKLEQLAFDIFAPKDAQTVTEWAIDNIVIPSSISAYGGNYQPINKYVIEPLNRAGELGTERLVLNWSTQASKTLCMSIILLNGIATNPRTSLVVFPSAELGRRYSIDRLQAIISASPNLHQYLPDNDDDYTNLNMRLKPATINIVGGNSPSAISSVSVGMLICDEIDQLPDSHSNVNGSLSLALQRTKAYGHNALTVLCSSPTCKTENGETIYDKFLETDMRYYYLKCPKCKKHHTVNFSDNNQFHVVFENVKDADGVTDINRAMESARLKCPCGAEYNDSEKQALVNSDDAEWRATNHNSRKGHYGYHAHTLLNGMVSMGEGVKQFLQSKNSLNALQNFVNNYCGEPFVPTADEAPNPIDMDNILSEFEQGEIIKDATYFIGCDLQQYYVPTVVLCQLSDNTVHLIDWQECGGFSDVQALQNKYQAEVVIIDANYNSKTVYQECYERNWLPCKGFAQMQVFYDFVSLDVEQGKATAHGRKRVNQMNINKDYYTKEYFKMRSGQTGNFYIYRNAPYELKKQLCSEVLVSKTDKRTGREKFSFRQVYKHNHALDACIYALAFIDYYKGNNIKKVNRLRTEKRKPINERVKSGGDVLEF